MATTTPRKSPRSPRSKANRKPARDPGEWWSQRVTKTGDAPTPDPKVFLAGRPREIARSLKWSAEHGRRRTVSPYRSAMSMLTFYIHRAGNKLPKGRLRVLEKAKGELRDLFNRAR